MSIILAKLNETLLWKEPGTKTVPKISESHSLNREQARIKNAHLRAWTCVLHWRRIESSIFFAKRNETLLSKRLGASIVPTIMEIYHFECEQARIRIPQSRAWLRASVPNSAFRLWDSKRTPHQYFCSSNACSVAIISGCYRDRSEDIRKLWLRKRSWELGRFGVEYNLLRLWLSKL